MLISYIFFWRRYIYTVRTSPFSLQYPWSFESSRFGITALFVWLISHQTAVLFSQNKPATSNQPTVLFSQNKSAPDISHQPKAARPTHLGLFYQGYNPCVSGFFLSISIWICACPWVLLPVIPHFHLFVRIY
jgi:hypothetical protein